MATPGAGGGMDNFSESNKDEAKQNVNSREAPGEASPREDSPLPPISKRAARRLLQRAFVLAGRDRTVRQHIREAGMTTLWVLEDWKFAWTVEIERGKVRFDRRPTRAPDLTLAWPSAEEFFKTFWEGRDPGDSLRLEGNAVLRRFSDPVYSVFCRTLQQVLRDPFDGAGNPLL
jgi:hypothetical protein